MLSARWAVRPGVPEGITNWAGPPSIRAVTSTRSASAPASTGAVDPSSTKPSPLTEANRADTVVATGPGSLGAPGRHGLPAHQPGQLLVRRGLLRPRQGRGHHVGRDQRPRRHPPPELLGHQGQVGEPLSRDRASPMVLGHQHGDPAQLGPAAPPAPIEAGGLVLGQVPDGLQRAGVLEELGGRS